MSATRRDQAHPVGQPAHRASGPSHDSGRTTPGGTLSIIIPAKKEASNLPPLLAEIARAFRPLVGRDDSGHCLGGFEVVVVDDGSTDDSVVVLQCLGHEYPELRVVVLSSNVGQSAATVAGIRASRGDWIGLLDADMQNPPADLATLWDALPGFDAALGWRTTRRDSAVKRIVSRIANRIRNAALGQSIRDTGCSVRIIARTFAERLPGFAGSHRFFGPLLLREGARIIQRPVAHRPRLNGQSHYGFSNRSVRVVVDLIGVAWLLRRPVRYEVSAQSSHWRDAGLALASAERPAEEVAA